MSPSRESSRTGARPSVSQTELAGRLHQVPSGSRGLESHRDRRGDGDWSDNAGASASCWASVCSLIWRSPQPKACSHPSGTWGRSNEARQAAGHPANHRGECLGLCRAARPPRSRRIRARLHQRGGMINNTTTVNQIRGRPNLLYAFKGSILNGTQWRVPRFRSLDRMSHHPRRARTGKRSFRCSTSDHGLVRSPQRTAARPPVD